MKKIFILFLSLMVSSPVFAKSTVIVQSLSNFSSMNPQYTISVKVAKTHKFKSGFTLQQGTVINSKVVKITEPKRGKRNVYIVVQPSTLTIPAKKQKRAFKSVHLMAKVTPHKKLNKKQAAQKGAVSATGLVIPGCSQVYYFCKGYNNPEKGKTRLASGGRCAYKNSPLVYVEKGDELKIKKGDYLKMKFYDENKPKWKVFKSL